MKIGNISFNPEAFKDYTKEQFFEEYKGKLVIDKEQVWEAICLANKAHESIDELSKPGKKFKRRGSDEGSERE